MSDGNRPLRLIKPECWLPLPIFSGIFFRKARLTWQSVMSSEERSCYSQNIDFFFSFLCIFKNPVLIFCVPFIFVVIIHTTHSSWLFYFIFYSCQAVTQKKAFLELMFVEIIAPENSHLYWRTASNACSEISVVLQDGNRDGGCVPRAYYKILLSIWMVMKYTNTVFSEESCWQILP